MIRQETRDFFREATAHYDPEAFAEALSAVPDRPAPKTDRLGNR